jgi:hypothetical protein
MTQTHFPGETNAPRAERTHADAARRSALRPAVILIGSFLGLSGAMVAFLAVVTAIGLGIDIAIWIRCSLVLASAVVLLWCTLSAARGSRPAWIRLRVVSLIVVIAVIVIVSIPGFLPDWVRLEQAVCGLLVLPVAIIANLPRTGVHFPAALGRASARSEDA